MAIRIPYIPNSAQAQPLRRCIQITAERTGHSDYEVATVMSHFLEEVSNEVCRNRLVRIPGFGAFGPKASKAKPGKQRRIYPAFSPFRGFQEMCNMTCMPSGPALDAIDKHRRHHHPSSKPDRHSTPFTAMDAFRRQIRNQAERLGMKY